MQGFPLDDEEQRLKEDRDRLIQKVVEIVGYEPPAIRLLIRTLAHPDVVGDARRYFEALDASTLCQRYDAPWTCAREAEARYENIKYGWLGGGAGVGFDEGWCDNCRGKVLNNG